MANNSNVQVKPTTDIPVGDTGKVIKVEQLVDDTEDFDIDELENSADKLQALADSPEVNGVSHVNADTRPVTVKPKTEFELMQEQIATLEKNLALMKKESLVAQALPMLNPAINAAIEALPEHLREAFGKTTKVIIWDNKAKELRFIAGSAIGNTVVQANDSTPEVKQKPRITKCGSMSESDLDTLNSKKLNREKICGALGISNDLTNFPSPAKWVVEIQKLVGNENFSFQLINQ